MQTTGERNYWQGQQEGDEPRDAAPHESQYVGADLEDEEELNHEPELHIEPITWQASEYVHHEKQFTWFMGLLAVTAIMVALAVFIVQSWTFAILVCVMAAATIVYARRPPRVLNYTLSGDGLHIDQRLYSFHDFRSFAVVQDGPLYSIMLIPVQRFMPAVIVYFPTENGEAIVDAFGVVLPIEQRELDALDRLVRKLRF